MSNYFSQEGLEKLRNELAQREGDLRIEIARKISDAKQLGDLSENAEYSEAREAQSMNEMRIEELKEILKNAVIMDGRKKSQTITIGSKVTLEFNKQKKQYTIVGPAESDPVNGFISDQTPLGAGLLGKRKGDELEVVVPSGKMHYRILDIN